MRDLLSEIDRDGITICWEPRGDWKKNQDRVKRLCEDLGMVHVTDIMRREPSSTDDIAYTRLHGLNENEYNYDYDYSHEELEELADELEDLSKGHERIYCMFNNYEMYDNADELRSILGSD